MAKGIFVTTAVIAFSSLFLMTNARGTENNDSKILKTSYVKIYCSTALQQAKSQNHKNTQEKKKAPEKPCQTEEWAEKPRRARFVLVDKKGRLIRFSKERNNHSSFKKKISRRNTYPS